MTDNLGTLVIAPIRPKGTVDTFPTAYSEEIAGGLHTVADKTDVTSERRKWGMMVYETNTSTLYQLIDSGDHDIDNDDNWQIFSAGMIAQDFPPNNVFVIPDADEIVGKRYKTFADALAYCLSTSPSPTNLWNINVFGFVDEIIYQYDYIFVTGVEGTVLTQPVVAYATSAFYSAIFHCEVTQIEYDNMEYYFRVSGGGMGASETPPAPITVETGAVYSNNGQTFTIVSGGTISTIFTKGTGVPGSGGGGGREKGGGGGGGGTLTWVSGVGPATITFDSFGVGGMWCVLNDCIVAKTNTTKWEPVMPMGGHGSGTNYLILNDCPIVWGADGAFDLSSSDHYLVFNQFKDCSITEGTDLRQTYERYAGATLAMHNCLLDKAKINTGNFWDTRLSKNDDTTPFEIVDGSQYNFFNCTVEQNIFCDATPMKSPSTRKNCCMADDYNRGRVVLFGGSIDGSGITNELWEYDSITWSLISPSGTPPSARKEAGMVFDSYNGVCVVFGGEDGSGKLNDLFTWDGYNWNEIAIPPMSRPSARSGFQIAYNSFTQKIIVFGGVDGAGTILGDTWELDVTTWTWNHLTPVASPSARLYGMMAHDGNGNIILYGGITAMSPVPTGNQDTWFWNGTNWSHVASSPNCPTAIGVAGMCQTNIAGGVILFGGLDATFTTLDRTWIWNTGSSLWTEITAMTDKPSPRMQMNMVADGYNGKTVMFGGQSSMGGGSTTYDDTWNYDFTAINWLLMEGKVFNNTELHFYGGTLAMPSFEIKGVTDPYHISVELANVDVNQAITNFSVPQVCMAPYSSTGDYISYDESTYSPYTDHDTHVLLRALMLGGGSSGWSLTGNAGTNPSTNFIGTTDNQDIVFKRNNFQIGKLTTDTTAFGLEAFFMNSTGNSNTAFGAFSFFNNVAGYNNVGLGYCAGKYATNSNEFYLDNQDRGGAPNCDALNALLYGQFNSASIDQRLTLNGRVKLKDITGTSIISPNDGDMWYSAGHLYFQDTTTHDLLAGGGGLIGRTDTGSLWNTFLGSQVGTSITTGYNNTAVGFSSLSGNIAGYNNTAVGYSSLSGNTTGHDNTAVGFSSLSGNIAGGSNTAVGFSSLSGNIAGCGNTAVGFCSLSGNIAGGGNTAVGYSSLAHNTGNNNIAFGVNSLYSNVAGDSNIAVGANSLNTNVSGSNNTAIGMNALYTSTVSGNTAVGHSALFSNTIGIYNTAVGNHTLVANDVGQWNTALGDYALSSNTSGNSNIGIGHAALSGSVSSNNNIAIGDSAGMGCGGDDTIIGWYAGANTTGQYNVALGSSALWKNVANHGNTAIGTWAMMYANDTVTGAYTGNVAVGYAALMGSMVPADNTGNQNTAVGSSALYNNTSGSTNTAIGNGSMDFNTTGSGNTALGCSTLFKNVAGQQNIAVGYSALYWNTANYNVALGSSALSANSTGYDNTAVGHRAGYTNTDGYGNTFVGYEADASTTSLFNATALGNATTVNASNKVRIGNSDVTVIEGQVDWTFPSDSRLKENIIDNDLGLDFINKLRPVKFNLVGKPEVKDGFIAQEVETAVKSLGKTFSGVIAPNTPEQMYSISHANFVVPLVKAVQELTAQNKALMDRLTALEALIQH